MAKSVNGAFSVATPSAPAGGESGRQMRDVAVLVTGYADGKMQCTAIDSGEKLEVSIRKQGFSPVPEEKAAIAKYLGNVIDGKMEKSIPVGAHAAIESLLVSDKAGDNGVKSGDCRWVRLAPGNKDKIIEGIITASAFKDQVRAVQVWAPDAVEPSKLDLAAFDEQGKPRDAGAPVGSIFGIQPRVVSADGRVVATIPMQSYNRDEKRPINGADVAELIKKAESLLEGDEKLEVCLYEEFPGSNNLRVPTFGPLNSMVKRAAPHGPGEALPWGGGVLAVNGVLLLSPGKYEPALQRVVGAEHNWANDVLCSGRKTHVHNMIRGADGTERHVDPSIDIAYPNKDHQADERAQVPGQEAGSPDFDASDLTPAPEAEADASRPRARA